MADGYVFVSSASTLATEPPELAAVAVKSGMPQLPPLSQLFEPGGLEMTLAISDAIGKYVPPNEPEAILKNLRSFAWAVDEMPAPRNIKLMTRASLRKYCMAISNANKLYDVQVKHMLTLI